MKKLLPLLAILILPVFSFAQPSQTETETYIRERVAGTVGHQLIWKDGKANFINEANFYSTWASYTNGIHNYLHQTKDNTWNWFYYQFKPEFIESVTEASGNLASNSPVGFFAINFTNNLVKLDSRRYYHGGSNYMFKEAWYNSIIEQGNVRTLHLPYLKQDPTAFERIKKALLHLKSFYVKADPFAN